MTRAESVAFIDVDETLISLKSEESFLAYYCSIEPSIGSVEQIRSSLMRVAQQNRVEANRRYYELWRGQPAARVQQAAGEWFTAVSAKAGFYHDEMLARLRQHQQSGFRLVFVSGSFAGPLAPIARAVGVTELRVTELAMTDGVLTGEILRPMIGEAKAVAVREYLAAARIDRGRSWGYGDHASDVPMLREVAHPVVVGDDQEMLALAAVNRWEVLEREGSAPVGMRDRR